MTEDDRGQIQFDFAVGVSILVMTIVVAFTFVPGLFGGVTEGRVQGDQVAADRVAAWLAEDALGDPSRPNRIDTDCTVALFDHSGGAGDCGFGHSSVTANVEKEFATLDRNVHVAILQGETQVYWDSSESRLDTGTGTDTSDIELASNHTPGGSTTISVATQPVSIDGYHATIRVRIW